jgi:6-phosphofructokinase
MARFGILTGGGDCPGLNAVIRGVVRAGVNRHGHHIIGLRYGWAGVLEANTVELTPQNTAGILHRGGTILGTSRTNPYKGDGDGTALVRETLEREGIDALIPIGGEDTLGVAARLAADGVPVFEVRPGVIATDMTAKVKEMYDRRIADGLIPSGRWGTPEDVGKMVAALLTGDVPYATGSVIHVDGGLAIPRL